MSTDYSPPPKPDVGVDGATLDLRRLQLEERRLDLDSSFARKWWPTLATLVVAGIGGLFGWVQTYQAKQETERAQNQASQETARAQIDAEVKEQHDWQTKIVEMYFSRRELFDLTKSPDAAQANLRVLIAVAPGAVQGVLNAELQRIPPPTGEADPQRLQSLAAAASVQQALATSVVGKAAPPEADRPQDFTVYVQYESGSAAGEQMAGAARAELVSLGYNVPNLQAVRAVPRSLEVRYYHLSQKTLAAKLVTQIQGSIGVKAPTAAVQFNSPKPLPSGILELWIPVITGTTDSHPTSDADNSRSSSKHP